MDLPSTGLLPFQEAPEEGPPREPEQSAPDVEELEVDTAKLEAETAAATGGASDHARANRQRTELLEWAILG
ncbi:hypothetical protein [Methanocorpusculum sp. GPch4]|uniref:hypothetical protein n=1 Tax=Methanocorpusculum sp. GPch4 TaxID=2527877 RepID=UPI001FD83B26|nr:hypothetical protein [Methanocorpusculum sp. GPch4]